MKIFMKLKNLFYALVAIVFATTVSAQTQKSAPTPTDGPLVITLEEALQIALSENPTVKIAERVHGLMAADLGPEKVL